MPFWLPEVISEEPVRTVTQDSDSSIVGSASGGLQPAASESLGSLRQTTRPGPTGSAFITVGSSPVAAMFINGLRMASNPVVDYQVPAGLVDVVFEVRDAAGSWSFDTIVTVRSGERLNLGRLRLVRR
jgi:hypothetical protein